MAAAVAGAFALAAPVAAQGDGSTTTTTTDPDDSTTTTAAPTTTSPNEEGSPSKPPADPAEPGSSTTAPTDPQRPPTTQAASRRSPADLIPPPLALDAIDQLAGVRRAEAVAKAQQLADAFNAKALEAAAVTATARDAARVELEAAEAALAETEAALEVAEGRVASARRRMTDLAVESYQLVMTDDPGVFLTSSDALRGADGYEDFIRTSSYSQAAASSLRRQRSGAEEEAVAAARRVEDATATRDRRGRELDEAQTELDDAVDVAELVAADGVRRVEDAKATGTALTSGPRGPAILAVSVVPAKYLAEFVRLRGRPHPSVDVEQLAEHYVAEGEAEGVAGDIAWAQSILETGWFNFGGSMVQVNDHNYAGIGACDSCSSGHGYPTAQLGVRAQIQLLRTYAQAGLTSAQLANPPAGRAPERSRVRGCCSTWMELTGVWATATTYGVRILEIYNELLVFAAARQRQDIAALAGLAPPAPPVAPAPPLDGSSASSSAPASPAASPAPAPPPAPPA